MKFLNLRKALTKVIPNVYHYSAPPDIEQYVVWAEDGQVNAAWSCDRMDEQVIQGTIDYFTKVEFDDIPEKLQESLSSERIPFRLNSVQREESTGYIHYEWVFEYGANDD